MNLIGNYIWKLILMTGLDYILNPKMNLLTCIKESCRRITSPVDYMWLFPRYEYVNINKTTANLEKYVSILLLRLRSPVLVCVIRRWAEVRVTSRYARACFFLRRSATPIRPLPYSVTRVQLPVDYSWCKLFPVLWFCLRQEYWSSVFSNSGCWESKKTAMSSNSRTKQTRDHAMVIYFCVTCFLPILGVYSNLVVENHRFSFLS